MQYKSAKSFYSQRKQFKFSGNSFKAAHAGQGSSTLAKILHKLAKPAQFRVGESIVALSCMTAFGATFIEWKSICGERVTRVALLVEAIVNDAM
jgi:hypothetical protein